MKTKWTIFCIKLQLLRLWFIKNLKTIIFTVFIIYLIMLLTGQVSGGIFFGGIADGLQILRDKISTSTTFDIIMTILSLSLSAGTAIGMFVTKTSSVTVTDIKSKKLKRAMILAGLYFNSDGKLVKRVEMYTETDITGDGKIVNIESDDVKKKNRGRIGIFDSVRELVTITTAKIEIQEDINDVLEKTDLDHIHAMDESINESPIEDEEGESKIRKAMRRSIESVKRLFRGRTLSENKKLLPETKFENIEIGLITEEDIEKQMKKTTKEEVASVRKTVSGTSQNKPETLDPLAERRRRLYGK